METQQMRKDNDNSLEELYEYISSASNDGFQYINFQNGYSIISPKWKQLFKINDGENQYEKIVAEKICSEDRQKFLDKMQTIESHQETSYEIEYRIHDGRTWISHTGTNRYDENGEIIEKFSFFRDISELKEKQLELEYMAYFDNETGVYNRNYFVKRLERAVGKIPNSYNKVQVLYLDIDNYNIINDSVGFILGDELIIKFAKMLNEYVTHTLKVGRFNNDEFAIAFYDAENDESALNLYKDIIKKLEKPIELSDGSKVYVSVSAGIASYPSGGKTAVDLIRCADIAMYNVKQHGKNGMFVFEENMLKKFMKNVKLEQKLKTAVDTLGFMLYYQPQYFSEKKELRGVEALIRWQLANGEYVSPGEFIPMAEKNGCIINIGTWVIKHALADYTVWKNEYGYDGIISINISAIQLREKNFKDTLLHYVEINNLTPEHIEIEITESVLIEDFESTISILEELRNRGFKVSLDDFGTGYSSLSYLRDIPIDTLKIDKSFVDTILLDDSTSIITDAVITMVKKLGLETIAEGVETEEQFEYLRNMHCDNIQGFLLGKPMPSEKLIELIMEENKRKLERTHHV
ncbi:MAG: EAL domain-containing protein [Lachnospiraceae bacterium]|nr:EAL domain-containing protein [Lachnospiraceae bacterium]